jgi:16S rRNA (guanine1516-N2)-methyltransferase
LGDEETDAFTHCLSIASHQLGTMSLSTYAIGIQTLNSIHKDKRIKQKRQMKRTPSQKPVYIEFLPSTKSNLGKRLNKQSNGEMLLKATGINKLTDAIIYDLTAGFAQDSMIFASSENVKEVHMVERDPIVGLLLSDAMRRLELISMLDKTQCSDIDMELLCRAKKLNCKLKLHKMDGKDIASKLVFSEDSKINIQRPDVCYLDPMFPPRQKSAAVKKNMQILHGLLQSNNVEDDSFRLKEEVDLLDTALALTKSRVVVKRPINAPPLGILAGVKSDVRLPSYDLKGTINRFDVYIL